MKFKREDGKMSREVSVLADGNRLINEIFHCSSTLLTLKKERYTKLATGHNEPRKTK